MQNVGWALFPTAAVPRKWKGLKREDTQQSARVASESKNSPHRCTMFDKSRISLLPWCAPAEQGPQHFHLRISPQPEQRTPTDTGLLRVELKYASAVKYTFRKQQLMLITIVLIHLNKTSGFKKTGYVLHIISVRIMCDFWIPFSWHYRQPGENQISLLENYWQLFLRAFSFKRTSCEFLESSAKQNAQA